MTCYQRHLGWLFEAVDVPYEKAGRSAVHQAMIELTDLPADAHCPEIWAALKERYGVDTRVQSEQLAADVTEHLKR